MRPLETYLEDLLVALEQLAGAAIRIADAIAAEGEETDDA